MVQSTFFKERLSSATIFLTQKIKPSTREGLIMVYRLGLLNDKMLFVKNGLVSQQQPVRPFYHARE